MKGLLLCSDLWEGCPVSSPIHLHLLPPIPSVFSQLSFQFLKGKKKKKPKNIGQWFSNLPNAATVPHIVVIPNHKIIFIATS